MTRRLRIDPVKIQDCLNRLDREAGEQDNPVVASKRQAERFRYRVWTLAVEIQQAHGDWVRYEVPTRNISETGVCFLIGHFVYPGTPCRLYPATLHGQTVEITGRVVRCRYLTGTPSLHEVGVQFDAPIDLAMFHRESRPPVLLAITDDPVTRQMLEHLLAGVQARIQFAESADEAVRLATETFFDAIVVDLDLNEGRGADVVDKLREAGIHRPFIPLASAEAEKSREICDKYDFQVWVAKPLSPDTLVSAVMSMKDEPIYSTLEARPGMARVVGSFVRSLPPRLTSMKRDLDAGRTDEVLQTLRAVKGEARAYGFEVIAKAAEQLESAIDSGRGEAETRELFNELVRLCMLASPQINEQPQPAGASS